MLNRKVKVQQNRVNIKCYFKKIDNKYRVHLIPSQKEVWIPASLVRVESIDRSLHLPNEYEGILSVPSWVKSKIDDGTFASHKPKTPSLKRNGKDVVWIDCRYRIAEKSILCDGNWIPRKFIHEIQSSSNNRPTLGRSADWSINGRLLVEKWVIDKIKAGKWGK